MELDKESAQALINKRREARLNPKILPTKKQAEGPPKLSAAMKKAAKNKVDPKKNFLKELTNSEPPVGNVVAPAPTGGLNISISMPNLN